jgi:hypothetical protein
MRRWGWKDATDAFLRNQRELKRKAHFVFSLSHASCSTKLYQRARKPVEIVRISTSFSISTELSPVPRLWCTDSGKYRSVVAAVACECDSVSVLV